MAEAALHLLPHLFMPHHDHDKHDSHGGLGDACTLIAVGFLAAFAIDRFFSARQQQQQLKQTGASNGAETAAAQAAAETAAVHASAALAVLRGGSDAVPTEEPVAAAPAGETADDAAAANPEETKTEVGEEAAEAEAETEPEEKDEPARDLVAWSTLTDDGAAGAMLASAHMTTPEKPRPLPDLAESTAEDAGEVAPSSEPELTLYGNPKGGAGAAAAAGEGRKIRRQTAVSTWFLCRCFWGRRSAHVRFVFDSCC